MFLKSFLTFFKNYLMFLENSAINEIRLINSFSNHGQ